MEHFIFMAVSLVAIAFVRFRFLSHYGADNVDHPPALVLAPRAHDTPGIE